MAEAPTTWWCPECGYMYRERFLAHLRHDAEDPCRAQCIEVSLLVPDMPLADLAAALRRAGYDVQESGYIIDGMGEKWSKPFATNDSLPCLTVAEKEPSDAPDVPPTWPYEEPA